jgi:class 3 adenylate cyclase
MAIFAAALKEHEAQDPKLHAEQAALAALELADYFHVKLPDWQHEIFIDAGGASVPKNFGLGVGLTMDSALVGNFAVEGGFHFTAVGRAPTIASRIEGKARCEELKALWPNGVPGPDPIIVLCSTFMREFFLPSSRITSSPLKKPVVLDGLDGIFDLAVLRRS